MSEPVAVRRDGAILEVSFDRPRAANAIDRYTSRLMGEAFKEFRDDSDLRVAIVKSGGDKMFCAGMDLKEAASTDHKVNDGWGIGGFAGLQDVPGLNKPVIACVNGKAVGGGFELAMYCDLIYASEHSSFALPEILVGQLATGAALRLPKRIPYHIAMDVLLTGRWMTAAEASHHGLVNEVLPAEKLEERVWEVARLLASGPPLVFASIKEIVRVTEASSVDETRARLDRDELATVNAQHGSEDSIEGACAFAEKRKPIWQGR